MEVLVKNPKTQVSWTSGLEPTFWSSHSFYISQDFSFSHLLKMTDSEKHSPFIFLDARISLLISLSSQIPTFSRGLGPLGTLCLNWHSGHKIEHSENLELMNKAFMEYGSEDPFEKLSELDQIIIFNEDSIDPLLWKRCKIGGHYIIGSLKPLRIESSYHLSPIGKLMPLGEPTEFGWTFSNQESLFGPFEFAKFQKLSD